MWLKNMFLVNLKKILIKYTGVMNKIWKNSIKNLNISKLDSFF